MKTETSKFTETNKFIGTKGDWDWNQTQHKLGSLDVVDVFSKTGTGLLDMEWVAKVRGEDLETQIANAKLLSAAPELLLNLQRLTEWANELNIDFSDHAKMLISQSEAAIKKALG